MGLIKGKYLGDLQVECVHADSGAKIVTDAPTDNNGEGKAFSPTDLCAAALGACAMTIIGIYGRNHNVDVSGTTFEIHKTMKTDKPRRLGRIEVIFNMQNRPYSDKEKAMIERAADICPVHNSFSPEVEQVFVFNWQS